MRIQEAVFGLHSNHEMRREYQQNESLRFWLGEQRPAFAEEKAATVQISEQARQLRQQARTLSPSIDPAATSTPPPTDPRLEMIRRVLEALTGKKIRLTTFEPNQTSAPTTPTHAPSTEASPPRQGWGLEYDKLITTTEQETMAFAAAGQVITSEGRAIEFQLGLAMERQQVTTSAIHLRGGDALLVDPLVITLDSNSASLGDLRFTFDLNGDGNQKNLPFVGPGSGFLAWDRNHDGQVNNGLELFGPATGHGFDELTQLDSDCNGWLDANDPRFAELAVWMKDAAGNDSLIPLKNHNIGAILIMAVETPFTLMQGETRTGRLKESSIFLSETGKAGAVQELDLAV